MYQGNTINNDNRRQFIIQNHYFAYQRKGNHQLQIQALNIIVADLQNHVNTLPTPPDDDSGIGTMWFNTKRKHYLFIMYTKHLHIVIKPCPKLHFSNTPPDTNINIAYETNLVYSLTETQGFEEWLQRVNYVSFWHFIFDQYMP